MTWVKLDDSFPNHPKVLAAGENAAWLYVCGLCYCSQHLTDGFIPAAALSRLTSLSGVRKLAQRLVEVGLWLSAPGGWHVHDYDAHQRTRAQVEAERDGAAARMRRMRDARRDGVTGGASDAVTSGEVTGGVTARESETEPELSSSTSSFTSAAPPVDDESQFDETSVKVRAVLDRCANTRCKGRTPSNPEAYRATVFADLQARELELRDVIAAHPTAPIDVLAGWMLGEANSLRFFRVEAAS